MRKTVLILLMLFAATASADVASKRAAIHEMLRAIGADAPDGSKNFVAFERSLTEDDAKNAIAFFRSVAGQHFLAASGEASNANLEQLQSAIDESQRKRTMADMRTIAVSVEAFAVDNDKYPHADSIDALAPLIAPTYVTVMPRLDAWGHPYQYAAEGEHYRITSAGRDGKFGTGDDLIYADGAFVQPKP